MEKKVGTYRHVVLFGFKDGTPQSTLRSVEKAFEEFCKELPFVKGFEGGTNSSPEKLDQGFTHCFLVTFEDAAARDLYLPHPAHQRFIAQWIEPYLAKVCVLDYEPGKFE
ncbi:MAG: Dabb family protein [Spirochaetales bacterium]